jgi:DNA-binding NarL/FixJ family response regulator
MNAMSQASTTDKAPARLIRVMVASERETVMRRFRDGLSDAPDILVLGPPAIPSAALLGGIKVYQPDVLLLGEKMLKNMGERAKERLVELPSHPRVLLLCDKAELRTASTVLALRFHGYIGSEESMRSALNAIRCILRGELWIPRLALAEALYGPPRVRAG